MESTEVKKSVKYDTIIASSRGMAEVHGKKVVIFVPANDIERITLQFGKAEHRPVLSMSIGIVFALVGIVGLIEFIIATRGYRYELGMIVFGIIGGSMVFDTLKERYFLEIKMKNGTRRLVFSKKATKQEIGQFCSEVSESFNYQIQDDSVIAK